LRKSECHEYLIVSLPKDKNEPEHPELEPLGEPIDIKAPWLMREEIEINPEVGSFDDFPQARLHEAASAADAFACSKETIWEVPDFPDRRGLRKDRSCATMKPP
jgi:hypothetical protein